MPETDYDLPIKNESFIADAKTILSLSVEQLRQLMAAFEQRKTLFSTVYVANLLNTDVGEAREIRTLLTFLIHVIKNHQLTRKGLYDQLVQLDVEKTKVSLLADLLSKLSDTALSAGEILYGVRAYMSILHVPSSHLLEMNYTSIPDEDLQKTVFFPVLSLTISSRYGEQEQSIRFDMDSSEFQAFVRSLQESLTSLKKESEVLKASLGEKYSELIVEQDGYSFSES